MEQEQMARWMAREWDARGVLPPDAFLSGPIHTIREDSMFRPGEPVNITMHWNIPEGSPRPGAHNHEYFEMIYVANGRFLHQMQGRTYAQPTSQILLMSPDAVHNVRTESAEAMVFNIKLRRSLAEDTMLRLMEPDHALFRFFQQAIYARELQSPYLAFHNSAPLEKKFGQLLTEYYEDRPDNFALLAHTLGIFSEISASCPCSAARSGSHVDAAQILRHIRENCKKLTLEEVAEHFNYSTRQIARILRQDADTSFTKHLNNCRIERVLAMMNHSQLPISALLERAGFLDDSYFYSVFKRATGRSFREYRLEHHL